MPKTFSALCAFAVFFTALGVPGAQATPASEAFIQQNLDKANVILTATSLSDAERHEQLRVLLLGLAASRRIALFTLGPYANGAAPRDIDTFVGAFTNYSIAVYENALDHYKGQTLKVTSSTDRAADDSLVQAEFVNWNPRTHRPFGWASACVERRMAHPPSQISRSRASHSPVPNARILPPICSSTVEAFRS